MNVTVRGRATPEELAAVLAALQVNSRRVALLGGQDRGGYERWRATRLAALKTHR